MSWTNRCVTKSFLPFILALSGLFSAGLYAQTDAGELKILVADSSGAVIPSASVKLVNSDTETSSSQDTNSDGYAVFSPIRGGNYDLEVSSNGFKTVKVQAVTIDVNGKRFERVVLQPSTKEKPLRSLLSLRPCKPKKALSAKLLEEPWPCNCLSRLVVIPTWRCSRPASP